MWKRPERFVYKKRENDKLKSSFKKGVKSDLIGGKKFEPWSGRHFQVGSVTKPWEEDNISPSSAFTWSQYHQHQHQHHIIIKPLDKNKSSWDWTEQFSCREWKSFHLSIFLVAILLPPPFSSTTTIVTSSFPSNLTNHLHPPISAFQASFTICETIHHHIHHSRHIATDHLLWRPDNQLPRTLVMIFNIWQHWINFLRFSKLPLTPHTFILGK